MLYADTRPEGVAASPRELWPKSRARPCNTLALLWPGRPRSITMSFTIRRLSSAKTQLVHGSGVLTVECRRRGSPPVVLQCAVAASRLPTFGSLGCGGIHRLRFFDQCCADANHSASQTRVSVGSCDSALSPLAPAQALRSTSSPNSELRPRLLVQLGSTCISVFSSFAVAQQEVLRQPGRELSTPPGGVEWPECESLAAPSPCAGRSFSKGMSCAPVRKVCWPGGHSSF